MENAYKKLSVESPPNGFVFNTEISQFSQYGNLVSKPTNVEIMGDLADVNNLSQRDNGVESLPKSSDANSNDTSKLEESLSDEASPRCVTPSGDETQSQESLQTRLSSDNFRLIIDTDSTTTPTSQVNCLSPLTPTSKFYKSMLNDEPSSLVIASVLCNWDNIFGPKVRCLWITEHERNAELSLELLNFIANQTLSGEIMYNLQTPALELKLYIAADIGIVLATLIFGAEGKKDVTVHSMSVIVPYDRLQEFLVWKDVCLEWMQRAVQRLRIELTKSVDKAYESFQKTFVSFIRAVESSITAGFPKTIELRDTALHPHHVFDGEFIRRAISAHLFQCQQSIVIGNSTQHVNLMINTLSVFISRHRKHRCRLLTDGSNNFYSPEFCLQGLRKDDESHESILQNVYRSRYPTALIDVADDKVFILCLPNEYSKRRQKFILEDLEALITEAPREKQLAFETLFQPASYDDSIVSGFLKEFHSLPLTHGVREMYARHFMSSLQRTALPLIQLTEAEVRRNSFVSTQNFLPNLRQTLSLPFFCDLMIVICVAELMKPGIMGTICGDEPRIDRLIP